MVRQRIYGILADYEDQNDHDTLRSDPVFKLIADRLPDGPDLASQPTLSRFENAVSIPDLWRLRDVLVDLFIQSFDAPPRHLTLDLDAFDDPAHGQQQLIMFHGYYEQYQYLPIVITCAENDMVLLVGLRHGTCHASLGADNDLRYLMGRLRAAWPDVQIHVRGDSGLGVPRMYDVCRELRLDLHVRDRHEFTAPRRQRRPAETGRRSSTSGPASRNGCSCWSTIRPRAGRRRSRSSSRPRPMPRGPTAAPWSRTGPAVRVLPQAVYDEYAMRGESENRNKELKGELHADRLSDHRFLANFFRLYLHAAALNLLVRLRHAVVQPPPTSAELGLPAELPTEAIDEPDRKRFFNKRRERDPLGGGFACTWRTRLIKVAAEVITRARRVIVRLSGSWPHLDHFLQVSRAVSRSAARGSPG